jgi:hypothetical protein
MYDFSKRIKGASKNENKEIVLREKHSHNDNHIQKHTIYFNNADEAYCIKPDVLMSNCTGIKGVKCCDYVIINITKKCLLFCELKSNRAGQLDKSKCREQLKNAKHLLDFICNTMKDDFANFDSNFVVFNDLHIGKRTKTKPIRTTNIINDFSFKYTGLQVINWDQLC